VNPRPFSEVLSIRVSDGFRGSALSVAGIYGM
jgi:hypothetical protein